MLDLERQRQARHARDAVRISMIPAPLGGCTRNTPRCADARDYRADLRDCCRGHIRELVAAAARVFEQLGITWWVDYGTLLGAVRNPMLGLPPGIIPHDKDADAGILWTDWGKLVRSRDVFEREGYSVRLAPHGEKMKIRLSALNHTNLDVFAWREGPGERMYRRRYIPCDDFKGRDFPKAVAFPLEPITWEGLELPAPRNPGAFCAFRYGPNWQTPIRANHDGVRR